MDEFPARQDRKTGKYTMDKLAVLSLTMFLIVRMGVPANAEVTDTFGTGIEQSPHNFSHPSWIPVAEICQVCHTYHNVAVPRQRYAAGLRWMRDVPSVTYVLYHSYWGAAFVHTRYLTRWSSLTGRRSNLPDGLSKLCLACHDGIIAPDVFILHHFVSAEYDVKNMNLRDPDITIMGMSGSITEVLDRGKIQCTSCHDVHGVESVVNTKLLREEPKMLCTTCHNITVEE